MRAYKVTVTPMDDLPGIHCLMLQVQLNFEESNADYSPLPLINISAYDDHFYLSGLWVPHTMRKEGLGSAVMTHAVRWASKAANGKMPLMLDVHPYGREAPSVDTLRKFYQRYGFERWPQHPTSMVRWPKEEALPVPVDLTNRVCAHCGGHEFHQPQGRSTVIECNRCGAQCEGGAAST